MAGSDNEPRLQLYLGPIVGVLVLLFALIFTMLNLIVDLLYAVLNPKLRHA